jgi:hypothetical protein
VAVAGKADHRGEEAQLLADLVRSWEAVVEMGDEAFAAEVAAGDRGRPRGGGERWRGRPGNGNGNGPREAAGSGNGRATGAGNAGGPAVPAVSPLRAADVPAAAVAGDRSAAASIGPAEPIATYAEPPGASIAGADPDEPPLPDEARARSAAASAAPTAPAEAGPGAVLHVRFAGSAEPDALVRAMEGVREVLRERPGGTRVVVHVPQGGGRPALPMELRTGVAYDAELRAEVARRLGDAVVDLTLA